MRELSRLRQAATPPACGHATRRVCHVVALLSVCLSALSACQFGTTTAPPTPTQHAYANPIQQENARPGTGGWEITVNSYAQQGEIAGYASAVSYAPGDTLKLAISTRAPGDGYSLRIFRLGYYQGLGARQVFALTNQTGVNQGWFVDNVYDTGQMAQLPQQCPTCTFDQRDSLNQETFEVAANWAFTQTMPIPATWVTGYYLALLTTAEGKQSYIPFIVRDDTRPTPYLVQAAASTWQAYNLWGGYSLYGYWNGTELDPTQRARIVSFNRPYQQSFGAGELLYVEYNFVRYLERQGYDVSYTTNIDISTRPQLNLRHASIVTSGHDEYWDLGERAALDDATSKNVDLLLFAGNNSYKKVRYAADAAGNPNRDMVDYRASEYHDCVDPMSQNPLTVAQSSGLWRDNVINRPENQLLGVMWNGGAQHESQLPGKFIAQNTREWLFAGAGLKDGDAIPGILGYEVDSLVNNGQAPRQIIVGQSPYTLYDSNTPIDATAILWYPTARSFLFNAATIDWSFGLDDFAQFYPHASFTVLTDPRLQRVTHNLLDAVTNPAVFVTEAAHAHR